MKLISESTEKLTKEPAKELMDKAIKEIIAICNLDISTSKESIKTEQLDIELANISKQLQKQLSLTDQSTSIKKDIVTANKLLDNEILNLKVEVLESLGSEL